MMDELVQEVARTAGLPAAQAALAVGAVLRFFTARLPSALVGELHARLHAPVSSVSPVSAVRSDDPAAPGVQR